MTGAALDALGSGGGAQAFALPLLYIGWDQHMLFAAPLCQPLALCTLFSEVVQQVLPTLYGRHPDFAHIEWPKVQWFRSSVMFSPDMARSLGEQGFGHQSLLRFRTPGLQGLRGSFG